MTDFLFGGMVQANTPINITSALVAANVSVTGTGLPTVGIFSPSTNQLGFATNSVQQMVIDTNGNMGIGTPSPSYPLTVVSNSSSVGLAVYGRSSDNLSGAYWFSNTGATTYGTILASATEYRITSTPAAAVQTFFTNGLERMRINSSGQVGINTTNPGGILQVNTSTQGVDGIIIIGPNTSSQNGQMTIRPNNGQGNNNGITQAGDSGIIYSSNAGIGTGNLVIAPWFSGVSGIRMNGSGNVGIATTNATAALHVYSSSSTANLTQWNGGTSDPSFITIAKSGTTGATLGTPQFSLGMDYSTTYVDLTAIKFARDSNAGGNMQFFTGSAANGAERMRIDSSGSVGIGTNSSAARLTVRGDTGDNATIDIKNNTTNIWKLWNDNGASALNFQYNGTTTVKFNSSGTANATQYTTVQTTGGSTMYVNQQQTTSVSTSATTILATPNYATLALVHGSDGTNRFSDLVLMSVGTGTLNVISSLNAGGSPAARTYTQASSTFKLAMASGTYTVQVSAICMNS